MVQYIVELAKNVELYTRKINSDNTVQVQLRLPSLVEELNRLDPRDFRPSARYQFVMCRAEARRYVPSGTRTKALTPAHDFSGINTLMIAISNVLGEYGGEGSYSVAKRDFKFITDQELRKIISRDYIELRQVIFPSGAWKSSVILAGSILEAILLDQLSSSNNAPKALASSFAPKKKDKGSWGLATLINVSVDIGIITGDRGNSVDQVIRDYRNFVHPSKELRSKHPCNEAEAMMAVGALEGVCKILE